MLAQPTTSTTAPRKYPSAHTRRERYQDCEPLGVVGPHIVIRSSRIFRSRLRVRPRSTVFSLWATHQIRKSRGQGVVDLCCRLPGPGCPPLPPVPPRACTRLLYRLVPTSLSPRPQGRGARHCSHNRATVRRNLRARSMVLIFCCVVLACLVVPIGVLSVLHVLWRLSWFQSFSCGPRRESFCAVARVALK